MCNTLVMNRLLICANVALVSWGSGNPGTGTPDESVFNFNNLDACQRWEGIFKKDDFYTSMETDAKCYANNWSDDDPTTRTVYFIVTPSHEKTEVNGLTSKLARGMKEKFRKWTSQDTSQTDAGISKEGVDAVNELRAWISQEPTDADRSVLKKLWEEGSSDVILGVSNLRRAGMTMMLLFGAKKGTKFFLNSKAHVLSALREIGSEQESTSLSEKGHPFKLHLTDSCPFDKDSMKKNVDASCNLGMLSDMDRVGNMCHWLVSKMKGNNVNAAVLVGHGDWLQKFILMSTQANYPPGTMSGKAADSAEGKGKVEDPPVPDDVHDGDLVKLDINFSKIGCQLQKAEKLYASRNGQRKYLKQEGRLSKSFTRYLEKQKKAAKKEDGIFSSLYKFVFGR